jgi:glutamin-(asparagin-)ase
LYQIAGWSRRQRALRLGEAVKHSLIAMTVAVGIVGLVEPLVVFSSAVQAQQPLPNVVVVGTGGTIAGQGQSAANTSSYSAAVVKVDDLVKAIPELGKVANVRSEQVAQIGSKSMTDAIMLKIAKRVNELLQQADVDGVVITHGTDTLEETSYLLNLTIKSDKPVVFAAAMRPSTALSADGPLNIYNAVILAGSKQAIGKGVLVSMDDNIFTARDIAKTNTFKTDTFRSPYGPLGYVVESKPFFYRAPSRPHTTQTEFDIAKIDALPKVDIVYGYANIDRTGYDAFVKAGAKAIINAGTGNANFSNEILPAIADARKAGVFIVRASRVGSGAQYRSDYPDDEKNGLINADDESPQHARILMALGLTKTNDLKALREMFQKY